MRSVWLDKPNKSTKNNDDMEEDNEIETLLEEALDTIEKQVTQDTQEQQISK